MQMFNNPKWRFRGLGVAAFIGTLWSVAPVPLSAQTPVAQAWNILQAGAANTSSEQRADTMRALQLLPGDVKAVALAENGLQDKEPTVRVAAASSLGVMKSKSSIPKLLAAGKDPDGTVVMAAAAALVQLGNEKGYSVYYAVLTGQRKSGEGLVAGEEKEVDQMMKNPKQMADMAFEQGMGYVPFGGVAMGAFQAIHGSEEKADNSWLVRAAGFDALARHGDSKMLPAVQAGLSDEKDVVKLAAAAAVVRLSTPGVAALN
jgi:HEAT repeat protein